MARVTLSIDGMSCGHCVAQVSRTLASLPGVEARAVEIGRAEIDYDPSATDLPAIEAALALEGYPTRRGFEG